MTWRACSRCGKSFDAVYRQFFGCRACGHVEPTDQHFSDITDGVRITWKKGQHKKPGAVDTTKAAAA